MVVPEQMSLWELYSYIEHLSENRQETSRYRDRPVVEDYLPVRGSGDDGAGAAVRLFPGSRGGGKRQNLLPVSCWGWDFIWLTGCSATLDCSMPGHRFSVRSFRRSRFSGASVLMMWKVEKR